MTINESDFRLTDSIPPAAAVGEYRFTADQTVTQEGKTVAKYAAEQKYAVTHSAFTLGADQIVSVYPPDGTAGDHSWTLPFATFSDRTLPWTFGPTPRFALLVLRTEEILEQGQIPLKSLFQPVPGVYFPKQEEFPSLYTENEEDLIGYVDISIDTYKDVFPPAADLPLLAHARAVDLCRAPDSVCGQSGEYSVVLANRFVPSSETEETVSQCHLVSTFGYGGDISGGCGVVRLVSLYHWSVRSQVGTDRHFVTLTEGLAKNCGEMGFDMPIADIAVLRHYTRTGETTYSLCFPPLQDGPVRELPRLRRAGTADGRLLYYPAIGMFSVCYALAFQLGRLITLSRPDAAEKILANRNQKKSSRHQAALAALETLDVKQTAAQLMEYAGKLRGQT